MKAQPTHSHKARQGSMDSSRAPGQKQQGEVLVDERQETVQQRQLQELMGSGACIQTKLTIGAVDDPLEREADRVAEQVMRMPEPSPSLMQAHSINLPSMQLLPLNAETTLQRQSPEQGEDEQQLLQPRKQSGQVPEVSPNFEAQIQSIRGAGQPLSPSTRAFFEPRFGTDFSGVRLHTDSTADTLNRAINARAFTIGRDVVFREGQYQPQVPEGQRLLAHELTHVVQQASAKEPAIIRQAESGAVSVEPLLDLEKTRLGDEDGIVEVESSFEVGFSLPSWSSTPDKLVSERCPLGVYRQRSPSKKPAKPSGKPPKAASEIKVDSVQVLPEKAGATEGGKDGETKFSVKQNINWKTKNGKIINFKGKVSRTIQTTYKPGVDKKANSAYGRGTTTEDKKAGNTSLEFHEKKHAEDYESYFQNNPLPEFTGKEGMTEDEFKKALEQYKDDLKNYSKKAEDESKQKTDCVGKKEKSCE